MPAHYTAVARISRRKAAESLNCETLMRSPATPATRWEISDLALPFPTHGILGRTTRHNSPVLSKSPGIPSTLAVSVLGYNMGHRTRVKAHSRARCQVEGSKQETGW